MQGLDSHRGKADMTAGAKIELTAALRHLIRPGWPVAVLGVACLLCAGDADFYYVSRRCVRLDACAACE